MHVYVAGAYTDRDYVQTVIAAFRAHDHSITYDWTIIGPTAEKVPSIWPQIAQSEINGVRCADVVVAILPGGRGTHAEIGAALALNIPVVLVGAIDESAPCLFYFHPKAHRLLHDHPDPVSIVTFVEQISS